MVLMNIVNRNEDTMLNSYWINFIFIYLFIQVES